MTYTIVTAVMKYDSTQESVLTELADKTASLMTLGWICIGNIVYFKNAVARVMIPINTTGTDVARMQPIIDKYCSSGLSDPTALTYEMGGFGHTGIKTKYKNGQYYDY
jgi:hypothetical protein